MNFLRSLVLVLAAIAATPAAAEPCRMGTNMPAGDANPARPINPDQARMVCTESVLNSYTRDGTPQSMRTWKFTLMDGKGTR